VRADRLLEVIADGMRVTGAPAPGERVLAMVSGGPDSLCLLYALAAAHPERLGVVTVDHGLRPEAADETGVVADHAAALGVQCTVVRLGLAAGSGVQARARDARYAAVRELAAREGWDVIATGHTASDQAETVLMRLARGSGRTGALGMAPRSGDLIRPLLGVTSDQTAAWCRAAGLVPADDPSNRDAAYTRVRARALLAELETLHPGAGRNVARFADLLRDEQEIVDAAADAAWRRCAREGGIDAAALAAEPRALRRLLARRLLADAGLTGDDIGAAVVDAVLRVAGGPARAEIPGGAAVRAAGIVRVVADVSAAPVPMRLEVPGRVRFGDVVVTARAGAGEPPARDRIAVVPTARITVRGTRPGDRIALPGGGHARVGRILQSDGVPAPLRGRVPVVVADEVPIWVAGHRVAAGVLADPGAPAVVLEVVPA
jgi:tRNA(Ile)-lysidine synthase